MDEKINMYLVQRGNFRARENKIGIDSIITWDYMGSAEFEWGALPKALNRVLDEFLEYELFEEKDMANINGVPLHIFCRKDKHDIVKDTLKMFKENPWHLKEYITFQHAYKRFGDSFFDRKYGEDFWFDIEHDFIWFFGANDRANLFLDAINKNYIHMKEKQEHE